MDQSAADRVTSSSSRRVLTSNNPLYWSYMGLTCAQLKGYVLFYLREEVDSEAPTEEERIREIKTRLCEIRAANMVCLLAFKWAHDSIPARDEDGGSIVGAYMHGWRLLRAVLDVDGETERTEALRQDMDELWHSMSADEEDLAEKLLALEEG